MEIILDETNVKRLWRYNVKIPWSCFAIINKPLILHIFLFNMTRQNTLNLTSISSMKSWIKDWPRFVPKEIFRLFFLFNYVRLFEHCNSNIWNITLFPLEEKTYPKKKMQIVMYKASKIMHIARKQAGITSNIWIT